MLNIKYYWLLCNNGMCKSRFIHSHKIIEFPILHNSYYILVIVTRDILFLDTLFADSFIYIRFKMNIHRIPFRMLFTLNLKKLLEEYIFFFWYSQGIIRPILSYLIGATRTLFFFISCIHFSKMSNYFSSY